MFEVGPTVPFEGEVREPLKAGQGTASPRDAVACVSQSWTVSLETTIAEGVGVSGGTKEANGVWGPGVSSETSILGDAVKTAPRGAKSPRALGSNPANVMFAAPTIRDRGVRGGSNGPF